MGLWQWIFDAIIGDSASGAASGSPTAESGTQAGGPAVALLDGPEAEDPEASRPAPWWVNPDAPATGRPTHSRPEMAPSEQALENLLASHLDGHDLKLPALPYVPATVMQALRKGDCDAGNLADLIAEDQVVAGAVLRLANSPLYRGVDKITSLSNAIARLGTRALRTLMMHVSVRGTMLTAGGPHCPFAEMLWHRSLATACLMQALSEFSGLDEEDAFLLGLLQDIGNVMVLRVVCENQRTAHGWPRQEVFDYYCQECHQEFGELIAAEWKLPASMTNLIADHHTYPAPDDPLRAERLQLEVADMMASLLGHGVPANLDLLGSRAAVDLQLAEQPGIESFLADLPDRIDEALNWTG